MTRNVLLLILMGGCGTTSSLTGHSATSTTDIYVAQKVRCFSEFQNRTSVRAIFHEKNPHTPESAGWSYPFSKKVNFVSPLIKNWDEWHLRWIAAHETCHESGWWSEERAEECAQLILKVSDC